MLKVAQLLPLALLASLSTPAFAGGGTALLLGGSVTGGAVSQEAQAVIAEGVAVEVATDAQWTAKTAAQFAAYRALVIGDPTCFGPGVSASITAATSNNAVWGPQCDGNTILIGTDEVFHNGQGGEQLTNGGIKFVLADATKTGFYCSLSCYYHDTPLLTPVPLLSGLPNIPGGFTVRGVGCYNNAHIVATHPAFTATGVTDATLSNWSCSVHEAFDTWPTAGINPFLVLAIAQDIGSSYTAPDGTVGTPYILARGAGLVVDSNITLDPALTLCKPINSMMCVTATVTENGSPVVGTTVTFTITAGPSAPLVGMGVTNGAGQATFCWTSAVIGVDNIIAQYVDSTGATQTSNTAAVEWCEAECYLVVGRGGSGSTWTIGNTVFNTQLTSVRSAFVVLMNDYPSFPVPNLPVGTQWNFSGQILMRNPVVFPSNPDQWSQRMRVTIDPGQMVSGQLFGTLNGINIGLTTFTDPSGNLRFAFPFTVNGM